MATALASTEVFAGTCVFENVSVDFTSSALGAYLGQTTIDIDGDDGICASSNSGAPGAGALDASITPLDGTDMNCFAGAAEGSGNFAIDPQLTSVPSDVSAVNLGGGIWTVAIRSKAALVLAGVGLFVQLPTDTADCAIDGLSSTTWAGVVVFEDPREAA